MELRSPVTGCVLNVFEESARVVSADTPILEIGDPTDLEAEVELLSSDAVNVKPGAEVSIEQWGGNAPLEGRVILVEPGAFLKVSALGVEEQRVKVRVRFVDLPNNVLGDRYRIQARITTWSGEDVLQVPTPPCSVLATTGRPSSSIAAGQNAQRWKSTTTTARPPK
jgi:HlyD family secretion protein